MADKRRYRATEGVIRWQRGTKGLCRCAKKRQECVFVAFRSTPLLCNWRPFRRPSMYLLLPEHPSSLTLLCCNWRPFCAILLAYIVSERFSISIHHYVLSWDFSRNSCQHVFYLSLSCQEVKKSSWHFFCSHRGPSAAQNLKWPPSGIVKP